MTPIRKVTVHIAGDRSIDVARNLVKEAAHLRDLVAHATEFTFRPNYGDVNDEFSDDPERRDAVVLSWRGPSSVEGGDPAFLADCRFSLDEAVGLMPGILRAIEAVRVPELKRMVEARTARVKP
jgi:hypothetical protein